MSVEVVPGGQRRIDRILDPGFTEEIGQLGLPELRARREEAEAEEADVSYPAAAAPGPPRHPAGGAGAPLGRGRAGCGRAARRPAGHPDRRLARDLQRRAPGPGAVAGRRAPAPGRAAGVGRDHRPPPRARRRGVDQGGEVPAAEEEKGSTHRRAVQRVVDVLRGELARRYRDGTAQVSQLSRVLIVDDDPAIRRVVSALLDLDEIADGAGSQFDPMVVDAFATIVPDLPGLHASLHTGGPTPGPHTGGPTPGLWTA